jgi:hypothetical protein
VALRITWRQALAWRLQRHLLEPVGALPVEQVVARLCGVQAQVASSAELAIRLRRRASRPGEVPGALSEGRVIDGDEVRVDWFGEAGACPNAALESEVGRLSSIVERDLRSTVEVA